MQLPNNEVGISDILEWRRCAARFAHGMRRHVELPPELQVEEGEMDDPTEATNENNAYGSCIHECISLVERGATHTQAIQQSFPKYARWLNPEDVQLLHDDLDVYERRRPLGVTLVAAEQDMRVPLFQQDGEWYYFRFKIDVLHRLAANPSVFIMRDYKSSRHRKTDAEVHADLQQFAYNFGVHEAFPECKHLIQVYDQLKFGEVRTTKNDEQRRQVKVWLIEHVRAILADEMLRPTANEFCRFCPLVVTCRETKRLTNEWRGKLAILAPLSQEGRRVKVSLLEDGMELERMIEEDLPKMVATRKHLEHVEKALKALIERMPQEERERLGWRLKERTTKDIGRDGLRELHEKMGDSFYDLVRLSVSSLEDLVGKPKKGEPLPDELQIVRNWQTERTAGFNVVPANSGKNGG